MEKLKNFIVKYDLLILTVLVILIGTLFIGIVMSNNSENSYAIENAILTEKLEESTAKIKAVNKVRTKEKDSLLTEVTNKEKEVEVLKTNYQKKEKEVISLMSEKVILPKNLEEGASFINKKYNTTSASVSNDSSNVLLDMSIVEKIVTSIEERDKFQNVLVLKEAQLGIKDSIIFNIEQNNKDILVMLNSAESEIGLRIIDKELADKQILVLRKQIRAIKVKSTLKLIIPISILAGILLIK